MNTKKANNTELVFGGCGFTVMSLKVFAEFGHTDNCLAQPHCEQRN